MTLKRAGVRTPEAGKVDVEIGVHVHTTRALIDGYDFCLAERAGPYSSALMAKQDCPGAAVVHRSCKHNFTVKVDVAARMNDFGQVFGKRTGERRPKNKYACLC